MELWHFDFLEGGLKTQKSVKNWQKLDLSILVSLPSPPLESFWSASTITAALGKGPQFANPRVSQLPNLGAFTLSLGLQNITH